MQIYSFFSVLLVSLLLFSCTQSNEEKAMALIETDMNQTLLHPSSFEVAKMELDSCFKDDKTHNAEIFRLGYDIATLYNKYKKEHTIYYITITYNKRLSSSITALCIGI